MKPVPIVGDVHHFFDDGKIRDSRHYMATVEEVLTIDKVEPELIEAWKEEVKTCYWLYAEETDYFVKCSIPRYEDDKPVWFVRTTCGGWFSIDYPSWWMAGRLMEKDFDYEKYKEELNLEIKVWSSKK